MLSYIMEWIYITIEWFKGIEFGDLLGNSFHDLNLWSILLAIFFIGSIFTIIWGSDDDI